MAHKSANLVQDTSTTTGTGTLTLSGSPPTGFQSFSAGIGDGNTCLYSIRHASNGEWEVGLGTVAVSGSTTLTRTTVLASSNSNAAVSFSSGTKYVRCVDPAGMINRRKFLFDMTLSSTITYKTLLTPNELPYSGVIASWPAASGATPTQSTDNNKPRVVTNAINGFPAVQFCDSQFKQWLDWSSGALSLTSDQGTLFAVARRLRNNQTDYCDYLIISPTNGHNWGLVNYQTEAMTIGKSGVSGAGAMTVSDRDGWHIWEFKLDGTNAKTRVDIGPFTSVSYAPSFSSTTNSLGGDSTHGGNLQIALLGLADGAVSDANMLIVANGLRDEFGL